MQRRQAKLPDHRDDDGRERLVDLDALHVADLPPCARERLLYRRDRSKAEHPGFDRRNAIGNEARHRRETALLRPLSIGEHDRGSAAVQPGGIPGRDGPIFAEGRPERRERFARRFGPIVLVRREADRTFAARHLDRSNLGVELARGLRSGEALL